MTLKLAWRNVRRSARDYGVYFLTLTMAVAMFYAFNSVSDQQVLFDSLSESSERMMDLLTMMMSIFSGAIAFVLAFLVVYANRFLLKRRKHEFGMYLTLGMGTGQVTRILLCETALVGLASLAVGLAVGVGVSQGMAFVTAGLMGTTMSHFRFIVSTQALLMTLLCFVAIFLFSAAVNVVFISRRKLVDLISLHESSEAQVARNPILSVAVFALSVVVLGTAYWQLSENGLVLMNEQFAAATVLMIVGTVGFFWSVSGFVLAWFRRSRSLRFKGLATFTVRQITSKVNTAFASMSVVCVMLFFAITTLAGGLAMVDLFVGGLESSTRYDATVNSVPGYSFDRRDDKTSKELAAAFKEQQPESYQRLMEYGNDSAAFLKEGNGKWDGLVKDCAQVDYYPTTNRYADLLAQVPGFSFQVPEVEDNVMKSTITVTPVSQFNSALCLLDEPAVSLGEGRFLVNNLFESTDDVARAFCDKQVSMELAGSRLTCLPTPYSVPMRTTAMNDVILEIVVPDSVVESLRSQGALPVLSYLDIMYRTDRVSGDKELLNVMHEAMPATQDGKKLPKGEYATDCWPVWNVYTANEMIDQASGMRMVITYLAVYIGFIFLLTTATVLAIQQLSEVTDSLPRYRRLNSLGVDDSSLFGSLRIQSCVYFFAPLALAACHSACALLVLHDGLYAEMGMNLLPSALMAASALAVAYLAFLLVTYFTSKSMVRQELVSR